ncbi:type II toxin-antitoxin system Phd/YefM family antitoxin [Patescibacteria group bacterium]|nr:type II toxin-antitoxin system Phd/YefM family antitoxin [Patescibacteria group bacterium]
METKTTLPISEARNKIFKIVDEVQKRGAYYTITEKGRPKAVLMSAEEFESWQETLAVQKMFPGLKRDINQARRDVKSGAYKKYPTLEEILKKEGFVLADKGKSKYVSTENKAKSAQRIKKNKKSAGEK